MTDKVAAGGDKDKALTEGQRCEDSGGVGCRGTNVTKYHLELLASGKGRQVDK